MELEFKHIAPYLPYGLNWFCLDKDSREIEELPLVSINLASEELSIGGMDITIDELPYPNGLTIKPILRPISDLTKEIEVNGEKFVPIIALYRLSNEYNYNNKLDYEFIDSWGAGKILKVFSNREKDEYTEFIYSDGSFRKDARCSKGSYFFGMDLPHSVKYNCRIYNQDKLQQKLLEWHFDVFGLIENGLAHKMENI